MHILVTGGAGFLGSHLVDLLLDRGEEVTVIDNLLTGRIENLAQHSGNTCFAFIQHDISSPAVVEGPVDAVLHLASPASPMDYLRFPIQTLKVGALGTHNALGLAKAKGARFLLASTSEVYGDPLEHPQSEKYWGNVNPVGPRGVYDEAKRFAEAMAMAYHRTHGLDTRIARIFNTFGSRMRETDGRVVSNFVSQSLRGDPLTVYGDGRQTRSFCFVRDLVEGIFRLLMVEPVEEGRSVASEEGGGVHLPVNLGNPDEFTILELAEIIIRLTGSSSEIRFLPLPKDDPKVRRPDISRAKSLLGWKPSVKLEEGLIEAIEDMRRRLCEG